MTSHLTNIITIFKPNTAVMGYALFLAINAAGVWGGVFPFLPMDFQTPEIIFRFFVSQALAFFFTFIVSAFGSYYYPGPTRRFLAQLATLPYMLGWIALIAAIYVDQLAPILVVFGGALLGLGSAGFYMLWQRVFAGQDSDQGNRNIILGAIYAALIYYSLYLIPVAVTAFLIMLVFLPLFSLTIILEGRKIDKDQPMFSDIPQEHPQVYRRLSRDILASALCVGAVGFCAGIMRSLAISDPSVGVLINLLSLAGESILAFVLIILWQVKNLNLNVINYYRILFPIIISSFVFLPFGGLVYSQWMAAFLYGLYSVAIMLMMMLCAQLSRERGVNPIFVYGIFAGMVYGFHDIGFMGGLAVEQLQMNQPATYIVVALFAVYLLGLMYFVGNGGFPKVFSQKTNAASIELVALTPPGYSLAGIPSTKRASRAEGGSMSFSSLSPESENQAVPSASSSSSSSSADSEGKSSKRQKGQRPQKVKAKDFETTGSERAAYRDRISKQAEILRHRYRLSARETEVMELIARGNSVARIAEDLVVSENTIRTHSKRIYSKLDIHKKQELLDLMNSVDLSDLEEM